MSNEINNAFESLTQLCQLSDRSDEYGITPDKEWGHVVHPKVNELASLGRRVEAIKLQRFISGVGLSEARDFLIRQGVL